MTSDGAAAGAGRNPNFDVLRLVAASSVIFSHAFAITEGSEQREPLRQFLGQGNLLGLYGVYTFFIISGFLITGSFLHRSSARNFLLRRCLRIFPGLALCVLGMVFVLGPLLTSLTPSAYLRSDAPLAYGVRTLALVDTSDAGLPGVVFSSNDYGTIVNGSLWTLGPEFLCYVGVMVLGLLLLLRLSGALVLLAVGVWTHLHASTGFLGNIEFLLPFFAAGSVLFFLRRHLRYPWLVAVLCLAGWGLLGAQGRPAVGFAIFGSVLVILIGTASTVTVSGATRFGDLSYGIYLYGWPVEESVRRALGDHAVWWQVFALSLLGATALALLSWHLVEARAIQLGRRLSASPARMDAQVLEAAGMPVSALGLRGQREPTSTSTTGVGTEIITVGTGAGRQMTEQFQGSWLVAPHDGSRSTEKNADNGACWGVAQTAKGGVAVYRYQVHDKWPARLDAYESIEAAEAHGLPADMAHAYRTAVTGGVRDT